MATDRFIRVVATPESRSAVMAQRCLPSMAALFRRRGRGASGIGGNNDAYELAARSDKDEQDDMNEFGALFEEEGLGPEALEARGDGFAATARRRSSSWRFRAFKDDAALVIAHDFKEAALAYVLAGNWRKAASAFGDQAVQILKVCPDPDRELDLHAAFALFRSARCYRKIQDKGKDELAAARLAFEKAISLYIEGKATLKAAKCCRELAEFYEEQQEWHSALRYFEEAGDYYGDASGCNPYYKSYCDKARKMGCIVARGKLV